MPNEQEIDTVMPKSVNNAHSSSQRRPGTFLIVARFCRGWVTAMASVSPTPGAMGHYDPSQKVSDVALTRKLPAMGALPPSPVRRAALSTALRSHAAERTVYENTMEKERQRQRKALLARMQQKSLTEQQSPVPERGRSAPASGESPTPGERAPLPLSPGSMLEERHQMQLRVAELEQALAEALAAAAGGPQATPQVTLQADQQGSGRTPPGTPVAREPEPEPEPDPEPEVEPECVDFKAEHRQWRDTMTFANNGRFWRSSRDRQWSEGSATAGIWRFHGATLTLQWFKRPESECLQTVDRGRTFIGVNGYAFKLNLPRSEAALPCPWLSCPRSLDTFPQDTRVHVLGVAAVKAAVTACEAMNGWTVAREERCNQCGVVIDTDTDGTVHVNFEDAFGVWLPFEALELEAEHLERCAVDQAIASRAEEEERRKQEQEEQERVEQQRQWDEQALALEAKQAAAAVQAGATNLQQPTASEKGSSPSTTPPSATFSCEILQQLDPAQWRAHAAAAVPVHGKDKALALLSEHIVVLREVVTRLHGTSVTDEAGLLGLLQTQPSDALEVATAGRAGLHAATTAVSPGAALPELVDVIKPSSSNELTLAPLPSIPIAKPAEAQHAQPMVLAVGGSDESSQDIAEIHAMQWDVNRGQGYWREVTHARLPFTRRHAAVCALGNGSILVCGGMDLHDKTGLGRGAARPELVGLDQLDVMGTNVSGTDSARVDMFGTYPVVGRPGVMEVGWRRLKNMPTRRRACQAVPTPDGRALVLGGAVYPGGRERGHPVLKIAESWCESLGGGADASGWIEQPDMVEARENFGACCVEFGDGSDEFRVVAVGGTTHMNIVLKSAECFDGKAWCAMPPMSEPREGCSCAALPSGRCVVAGGSGDSIELFDFEQGAWTTLASMAVGRAFCGVCYASDHLFVSGGFASDWTSHASVEVLDVGLIAKNAGGGGGGLKPLANSHRQIAPPVGVAADVAAVQSVEENLDSWLDKWTQMTEEEQEAFKKAEKETYRRVQKGTSRGFSRIWDAKLKAVDAHKKRHASGFSKLKAVTAFGVLGGGGLGGKLEALKDATKPAADGSPKPVLPPEAKPETTPPPSPRGFKTVSVSIGGAAKQPTVEVIAKRRWRSAAPMTRPRRWMQLVVAALPDPTEPVEPIRPRIPTPTITAMTTSLDLPPVPKVAQTPEEVAALVKQLSGLANTPDAPKDTGAKVAKPSAGFGIFG